jgi:ABC-type protease/lipase transport system fused ATPase/permease subunit
MVNLLMLAGPLFLLQVYDRVLTSRSVPTLVSLLVITAVLYAFLGLFDFLRARVMSRLSYRLDARIGDDTLRRWLLRGAANAPASRPIAELTALRQFFGTPAMTALMDLPWMPLYLLVVFGLHVQLGVLACCGARVAVARAVLTERRSRRPMAAPAAGAGFRPSPSARMRILTGDGW